MPAKQILTILLRIPSTIIQISKIKRARGPLRIRPFGLSGWSLVNDKLDGKETLIFLKVTGLGPIETKAYKLVLAFLVSPRSLLANNVLCPLTRCVASILKVDRCLSDFYASLWRNVKRCFHCTVHGIALRVDTKS